MRKSDQVKLGDIYGAMLKNVAVVKESKIKEGGNDLSDKNPSPLADGGPQEKGGFHKSLEDAYKSVYDEDEEHDDCDCEDGKCTCNEEDNEEINKKSEESFVNQKTKKLEAAMNKPGVSDETKKKLKKQIDAIVASEDEENITESKKIAKRILNNVMAKKKSTFDKLFESVIKENFGFGEDQNDDLDALGLDDAASDDEFGDDTDFGSEEEDSVTFTLDRATAQTLIDVLQGALGDGEGDDLDFGDEGDDLDFGDEGGDDEGGMDFEEDEENETVGAKDAKGGGTQHKLQGRNNKVAGRPQPKGGSAQHAVTDKVGNDGDYGHALHGAKKYNDGKSNKVSNLKQGADLF
jgi:hypothetical protein